MSQPSQPSATPSPSAASLVYAGTGDYIAAPELMQTVNVAVRLSRPLLINREPGIEWLRRLRRHFDHSV